MGRTPKPWWREDRQAYYASVHGVRHRLGTNLKDAKEQLKKLLGKKPRLVTTSDSVTGIFDLFLAWTKQNRSDSTHGVYYYFLDSFCDLHANLAVDDLTTAHITEWLTKHPAWNSTTQCRAIEAVSRALNWGTRNAGLAHNPILGMEKPAVASSRIRVITIKEFRAILRATKDRAFRRFLIFCWDTGCRPQEAKALEPRHADIAKRRCVLPPSEAKGKKKPRAIYLATSRSVRWVQEAVEKKQSRLFLNFRGKPWTKSAVKCRFYRIEKKIGKHYRQYDFRHTWITRKLVAEVDSHVVATLAGHTDTRMIDKVYSHVADDYQFMLEQAGKEKHHAK